MSDSKRHFPWYLYVAIPLGLFAVAYGLAWKISHGSTTQNFAAGDRAMLVTAPEVYEQASVQRAYNPRAEVVLKELLPRGGRRLTYTYSDQWIRVTSLVIAELDSASAVASFESRERPRGLEPHEWGLTWGEARVSGTWNEGGRSGTYLLARSKTHVVEYRIDGADPRDPLAFVKLMETHLGPVDAFTAIDAPSR